MSLNLVKCECLSDNSCYTPCASIVVIKKVGKSHNTTMIKARNELVKQFIEGILGKLS